MQCLSFISASLCNFRYSIQVKATTLFLQCGKYYSCLLSQAVALKLLIRKVQNFFFQGSLHTNDNLMSLKLQQQALPGLVQHFQCLSLNLQELSFKVLYCVYLQQIHLCVCVVFAVRFLKCCHNMFLNIYIAHYIAHFSTLKCY